MTVTRRLTTEDDSITTSDLSVTFDNLNCCEEYDFAVSAGNSDVFGDYLMHNQGFRTQPDLSGNYVYLHG